MTPSGIRSPLESRVLHVNGIALHVVLAGPASGKPLILLHGFPEFWFAWRRQIDHFVASGYRVIIPDQRGYNFSDKPAGIGSYSIDLLVGDVVGVLDSVAGSKAFVVGHDWGAVVTWYLAARYPERVTRTAILSVPPPPRVYKEPPHKPRTAAEELVSILFSASLATRIHSACARLRSAGSGAAEYFTCWSLF
jgi:pimeloyl-ACP methyl ester carboxylesterase